MSKKISHTDLLLAMLSIPAVSREEKERADFLEDFMKDLDWNVTRIHHNLLVGDPEAPGTKVLMNSHLDTVPPVNGWTDDPFTPRIREDKIIALGSNDAGASVVSMLTAFGLMREQLEERFNLMLLISAEEEVSGPRGISSVLPLLGDLGAVVVGEPTGMAPAVAERGLMVLDGEVSGKAGHAARNEGENAIYTAMEDIRAIDALKFPEQSDWLPAPGARVTMISAGTRHNVVPDRCQYVVDVRSNERYGNERLLEMIRSVCQAELTPRSTRLHPSCLDGDHWLMKAALATGVEPFGSSTLSDMALIPFPAIKMGPGASSRSHTADEYILKQELEQGVSGYCRFLEQLKINSEAYETLG